MQICYAVLLSAILLFSGCSSLPKEYHYTKRSTFQEHKGTAIDRLFASDIKKHPKLSGFYLIPYGEDALTARIAMCDLAEKSLDMQYYLWHNDDSGVLLAQHVIKAANRGVKVRILIDDIGLQGKDSIISSISAHPNIDIRIFNPFAYRYLRIIDFLSDFDRLNHRMHNKTFIVDNRVSIIGGRNIGDQYFALSTKSNFRDLDIVSAGPIVRQISNVYEHFWSGSWSMPIELLVGKRYAYRDLLSIEKSIDQRVSNIKFHYRLDRDLKEMRSRLVTIKNHFIWAEGYYIWDDPEVMSKSYDNQKGTMIEKLSKRVKSLKGRLYIESAYFIPRDSGIEELKKLHNRGIKIRVLTNSLASNDVVPAHAGYAGYREDLIRSGVELYELREDVGGSDITNDDLLTDTKNSGLHTKSVVFDDSSIFVGSFNLDPRSASINTEGGLYIKSKKLTRQLIKYMDQGVLPEHSYRVLLDKRGDLLWSTQIDGKTILYHTEPKSSIWKRFQSNFIGILPIELQL